MRTKAPFPVGADMTNKLMTAKKTAFQLVCLSILIEVTSAQAQRADEG